jgi:hypothetical protein
MWQCGRHRSLKAAFLDLARNNSARQRAAADWKDNEGNVRFSAMIRDIEGCIGKGRFAQRWAARISRAKSNACPTSIEDALNHVIGQVS